MAIPDQLKLPLRSADPRRQSQPGRANDAVAGQAAHVLSLQRTLGNRATSQLLSSWRPAGAWLQRALRGKEHVVSGRTNPLDEVAGRRILGEFSRNDPSSVPSLVGVPGHLAPSDLPGDSWALAEQEWGLIRETTGEVHLIFGKGGLVSWGPYRDEGTPLAHSHPWRKRERQLIERTGGTHSIATLLPDNGRNLTAEQGTARSLIVPTISDFVVPATLNQTAHTVFTPYAVDAHGNVSNPQGAGTQRLVWELSEIQLDRSNPDQSTHRVTGRLTAKRGAATVWTRRVQAPAPDITEILKSTQYTILGA